MIKYKNMKGEHWAYINNVHLFTIEKCGSSGYWIWNSDQTKKMVWNGHGHYKNIVECKLAIEKHINYFTV